MAAFIKFNKGLLRYPSQVKVWLIALIAVNLVAPLFYVNRIEAQTSWRLFSQVSP